VKSIDDPFLSASLDASRALTSAMVPGKFLVDAIPIRTCPCVIQRVTCEQLTNPWTVRYLPDWFPGTGFKAIAQEARDKFKISLEGSMEYVKKMMKVSSQSSQWWSFQVTVTNQSGEEFSHSITSDCLSRLEDRGRISFDEEVISDVSGTMFGGEPVSRIQASTPRFLQMV
jgi:hypothetical protein